SRPAATAREREQAHRPQGDPADASDRLHSPSRRRAVQDACPGGRGGETPRAVEPRRETGRELTRTARGGARRLARAPARRTPRSRGATVSRPCTARNVARAPPQAAGVVSAHGRETRAVASRRSAVFSILPVPVTGSSSCPITKRWRGTL